MDGERRQLIESCKKNRNTKLYFNYMNVTEFPEEILEIIYLKELYLKRNLLRSLPNDINALQSLVTLYLDSNMIESIPDGISDLKNLQSLELNRNQVKELPSSVCQLLNLRCLHLSHTAFPRFPLVEIGRLKKLETLNLMNNQIARLPKEIGGCESLITLQLDCNRIQYLPNQLLKLCKLQDLSVSRNEICRIPNDIHHLVSLTDLALDANKNLKVLPGSLILLSKLQYLGLHNCIHEMLGNPELADSIALVMKAMQVCWAWCIDNSPPPLVEICIRFIGGRMTQHFEKVGIDSMLPSHLRWKLENPIGSCISCNEKIYNIVFPLVKNRVQMLKICDSLQNMLNHLIMNIIQRVDNTFVFLFLFCSYKCMVNYKGVIT